jgi:hypothetical protein
MPNDAYTCSSIMQIDQCASEVNALMKLANAPQKLYLTGGGRGLMTIPKYHTKSMPYHDS